MIALNWGGSKARIWLDKLPPWYYEVSEVIERHLLALNKKVIPRGHAAVELSVHTGPRVHYGGLGATFVPAHTGQLLIQVSTSADKGQLLSDSLVGKMDKVHIGLPTEYAAGVLKGVMNTDLTSSIGNGTLHFCCAVHGEIGSSPWMFQALSRIVIRLLCVDKGSALQEDMIVLLQQELSWRA